MPVRIVQSKQNARLKRLRLAFSHPEGNADGLAGIEGPNLLEEAVRSRARLDCVFVAQGAERLLEGIALPPETEILAVPEALLLGAMTTETPQPVAALVEKPNWRWEQVLHGNGSGPSLILVLDRVQDPGNLGTILRSAEAFGASGLVCLPGTVSCWNAKAVRASAGSVLRIPVVASGPAECFRHLRKAAVRILSTNASRSSKGEDPGLAKPVALLIGNEAAGVSPELAHQADGSIHIPCPGPVESLNAAVAASILLYEASRQRGGGDEPLRR